MKDRDVDLIKISDLFFLSIGTSGWEHNFTFHAYDEQRPGTEPYGVGHADNGIS